MSSIEKEIEDRLDALHIMLVRHLTTEFEKRLRAIDASCGIPDKGDALRVVLKRSKEAQEWSKKQREDIL